MPTSALKALSSISQIDLTQSLKQILEEILAIVGHQMGARSGSMMLVNEETGELELVATFGLPDDCIQQIYSKGVPITNSPSGVVLKTGRYYTISNIFEEPGYKPWADLAHELGISAQLFMPMKSRDEVIGLLNIYMAEPHEFTEDEIAFGTVAASQAAAVIEKARLYSEIRKEKVGLESKATEHKYVQELLWKSREILSNILSASPIGIGIVKDRKLIWANERMMEMFGVKPDEDDYYIGQRAEVIYASKEEYERVCRICYEELKESELVEVDAKLKRRDGSIFDGHIKMSFLDPSNPAKGAVATISDISWRQQAEEALRGSEEKYRTLTETVTDVIFTVDTEGKFTYVSPQCEEIVGFTGDDLLGRSFTEVLAHEYIEPTVNRFKKGLAGEETPPYEAELLHKDGRRLPVELNMTSLLDFDGQTMGRLGVARDIGERKRMDKALRESEEKYRKLVENVQDGIFILQGYPYPKLMFCNEAFAKMVGYTVEEMMALTIQKYVAPDDLARVADSYRRRLDGEDVPREYEYHVLHKDGKTPVYVNMHVELMEYLGKIATIGTVKDITEKKRMEEELRQSETLYRTFFEITRAPTVILDENGTFYRVNTAGEKISGFTKEELEGKKKWTEFIAKKEDLEMMKKIHQLRRTDPDNAPMNYEFLFRDRYGNLRNIYVTAAVIPGSKKSAVSFMDITERKLAEEALRESEERFRSLFDNLSVGVAMVDREGQVLAANKTVCRFLGYSQEELIGMPLSELIYPEDLDADGDLFKPIIKGEEDHCLMDKRYVRKDGEIVWGRLHLSGVKDEEGHIKYMSVICEDITACKLVEKALLSKDSEMASVFAKCKHMKEALNRSEQKYKEIAEFLPDLIYKTILLDA